MRKTLLIWCFLLGTYNFTFAQTNAVVLIPTVSKDTRVSHTDTVQSVHRLFSKHRTGGWIWTAVGSAFAIRIISVAASSSVTEGFTSTSAGTATGVGLFGGLPVAIGIGKLARFSKTREEQVIEQYEKTHILPRYVKKRLKAKYFSYH